MKATFVPAVSISAADVDDRAFEDRVCGEAIDHGFDLAIVERAAIAREKIVDRRTILEVAFSHSASPWRACLGQALGRGSKCYILSRSDRAQGRREAAARRTHSLSATRLDGIAREMLQ